MSNKNEVTIIEAFYLLPKFGRELTTHNLKQRLSINDYVLRVFILCKLDELYEKEFDTKVLELAFDIAKHSQVIRTMLINRFSEYSRIDLLDKLYELEKNDTINVTDLNKQLIFAQKKIDYKVINDIYQKLYIYTGNVKYFNLALNNSHNVGWEMCLNLYLKKLFMSSKEQVPAVLINILRVLQTEGKFDTIKEMTPVIQKMEDLKILRGFNLALNLFGEKKYKECVDFIMNSNLIKATENNTTIFLFLTARCFEKLKEYKKAIKYYKKQNDLQVKDEYSLTKYIAWLDKLASFKPAKPLEDKEHDNYFIMTGFPRSGTTLLENALASHDDIVTCEETSALIKASNASFMYYAEEDPEIKNIDVRMKLTQKLYYENINRYVKKHKAKCIIDKSPIISSNIHYLEKIFPNKRYIFSIRHPYDVVLSCFKQVFKPNIAMAAFNDFYDSCVLYNRVMTKWFDLFPEETSRVHYVYYHELVLNFQSEMEKILKFLNVEWTDEVLNFVEHSKKRVVKTPSYENVRKGLDFGVQSSWKNYEFLFNKQCRALLDPWVEKFGYN